MLENSKFPPHYLEAIKEEIIKHKPYLKPLIAIWESQTPSSIAVYPAKKRGFYLAYQKPLSSQIDPVLEAERICRDTEQHRDSILFFFGAGNVYIFDFLLRSRHPKQITILIEKDRAILSFLWERSKSFHEFLLTPSCHIFSEENLSLLWQYLSSLSAEKLRGYRILKHNPSLQLDRNFYWEIERKIAMHIKSHFSSLLTRFEFETLWFRNILINSRFLSRDYPYNRLIHFRNAFSGYPFAVVGAGPSLQESKEILEYLKRKSLLIATDAALKPMLKMGVIPDFVNVLDAQIHTYFHLRGAPIKNIPVLADTVIHPLLPEKLTPAFWIFCSTIRYYGDAYGNYHKEKTRGTELIENLLGEIGSVQSGGSVSTNAFEIARFLGARVIFLAGQDLSWTNRQLHAKGTYHYEKWLAATGRVLSSEHFNEMAFQKRKKTKIESLHHTVTYGDAVLDLYRLWFEETALELRDQVKIYNLTKNGALLQNVPHISLHHLEEFPDIDRDVYEDWKNSIASRNPPEKKFSKEIHGLIETIYRLLQEYQNPVRQEKNDFYRYFLDLAKIYPDLEVFSHRVDTYILRNEHKLTEEKKMHLRYSNIYRELYKLVKSYISFNTSLTHSANV